MVKFSHFQLIWLLGFILVVFGIQLYYRRLRRKALSQFAGSGLADKLLDNTRVSIQRTKQRLILGALIFIGIALIGPKVGQKLTEVKRKGVDIIIAFDTSISMNAEDVKPNRLMRAKYETGKFINRLRGDRIGLVAFAGISYLQCPLTMDYSAAKLFLDVIDTGVIGTQGTAIADALETSLKAFKSREKKHKVIVVISDGEDHEGDIPAVMEKVKEQGAVIYSVGVGTLAGSPIPVKSRNDSEFEFKRDRSGRVVTSALEEGTLREIATLSGGSYYNLRSDADVFGKLYNEILKMEQKEIRSHEYSDYQERYQLFLVIGIILLIINLTIAEKRKERAGESA
ncbi:MAG: VWA domain-containing protein [Candidatus Marinimicrobia bacterium]|nr:VWA domain-containing protein [Candidatus Neomarinimicrobiota bacterium]